MSKTELKGYFNWFLTVMPERLAELEEAVRKTPGFQTWKADFTPDSLGPLGDWLATQVETRPRSSQEVQEKYKLPFPEAVPDEELTDHTISIAMDIGMYLGKTLQNHYGHLQWAQYLDNKRFIDYGQPVLIGFGKVPMNPFRIVTGIARSIKDDKNHNKDLRELYNHWAPRAAANNGGRSDQPHIEKGARRRSR